MIEFILDLNVRQERIVKKQSPFTGEWNSLHIKMLPEDWKAYITGGKFSSDVPPEVAEFLMTGITPDEWEAEFGGLEE